MCKENATWQLTKSRQASNDKFEYFLKHIKRSGDLKFQELWNGGNINFN